LVALNRMDAAPDRALSQWRDALGREGAPPLLVDAKKGTGIAALRKGILEAGKHVNERRVRRGIKPRPVRAAILGYPNVGKSALINKVAGRKRTKSENRPGVTRGFSWISIDSQVQLLDSPGIIPAKQVSQPVAYRLAMCDDIGSAAYDKQFVAAALLETLWLVSARAPPFARLKTLHERYGLSVEGVSGEEYLRLLAEKRFTGDVQRAAATVLKEFRSGTLGRMCLELPDGLEDDLGRDDAVGGFAA